MITHVKRNSQKIRTAYIKPSRIEAAVHLNSGELFQTTSNHHKSQGETSYSIRNRDVQIAKLNEYIRKIQTMYNSFPYPPFSL